MVHVTIHELPDTVLQIKTALPVIAMRSYHPENVAVILGTSHHPQVRHAGCEIQLVKHDQAS